MDKYQVLKNKLQEVHQEIMAIAAEEHDILGVDNTIEWLQKYLERLHAIYQGPKDDYQRINRVLATGSAKDCMNEAKHWIEVYIDDEDAELETLSSATMLIDRAIELL